MCSSLPPPGEKVMNQTKQVIDYYAHPGPEK